MKKNWIVTLIIFLPVIFVPVMFAPEDPRKFYIGIFSYVAVIAVTMLFQLMGSVFDTAKIRQSLIGGILGVAGIFLLTPLLRSFTHSSVGLGDSPIGQTILLSVLYYSGFMFGAVLSYFSFQQKAGDKKSESIALITSEKKICDTSVLIDGRLADMADAGFLDGEIIIPQFILRELQSIADSADQLKRNRGRRGLDIVKRLQDIEGLKVSIPATDFPSEKEVDHKLLLLALDINASLITNDFNLNKVAKVRSIKVLNLNDLVNALKTIYLPGEEITVPVTRAGKEPGQGIAYLDDGTMVVMDGGANHVGKMVKATVTNIHQTTAGRMIFSRFENISKRNGEE
ncbi:MAG: PIN domain nuclease [Candidatus Hydrogenedentes bacterium CG07_land_8_20_14_0_80_42_17]|nr:MAG: PIN domain nuclease [Candidatus Hydrogenedentes bacterium CG07_land_8_20_14_0_80_42_17]